MRSLKVLLAGLLAVSCSTAAYAETSSFTVGSMATYSEGDFGTGSNTKIWYVPTYFVYRQGNVKLKLTVPYISVESQGAVVSGGSVIGRTGTAQTTREGGLGDIWLEGKYTVRGSGAMPDLVPYAKVKFGTASASRGLGTGKNDYESGLDLEWVVGSSVFPFATLGYRVVGKPANTNLRNILTYDAGSSFMVATQHVLTLMYSGRQSAQPGFPAASDAIAAWNYDLTPGNGFQVYVDKGLSTGSPNYSVGIGGQVRF